MNLQATDQHQIDRAKEMDRQSRLLWLKTFGKCLERSQTPKAADEAGRAVERFRMAFDDPKLETPRGYTPFPWCELCESFHHPDNPTCAKNVIPDEPLHSHPLEVVEHFRDKTQDEIDADHESMKNAHR